jgi:hypothetical protein
MKARLRSHAGAPRVALLGSNRRPVQSNWRWGGCGNILIWTTRFDRIRNIALRVRRLYVSQRTEPLIAYQHLIVIHDPIVNHGRRYRSQSFLVVA